MPVWLKVVAVVGGVLVLLLLLCVGGSWLWFSQHKDELVSMGKEASEDAKAFGNGHNNQDCLDEGMKRGDACDGIMCEAKVGVFMEACFKESAPSPGFCDGVPAETSFMDSAKWRVARCTALGPKDRDRCSRLLASQQKFCHPG